MAKKKAPEDVQRSIIRVKTPVEWAGLIGQSKASHWRRLQVTIQVHDRLLAGKPALLFASKAMVEARGLGDQLEVVADIKDPQERADTADLIAKYEGLCEFHRREGRSGIWFPANHIKAGIKENWSVLGMRTDIWGSRKAVAEGMFVLSSDSWAKEGAERDWVYLGKEPAGVYTAVAHSTGPRGPVSSIKRHEFVERPRVEFDILIADYPSIADKISDDNLAQVLVHFGEHGLGACRSQGFGKFSVLDVRELELTGPAEYLKAA